MTRKWQPLRSDEVHLWNIDLRALAARQEGLHAHLSREETERASRFQGAEDAARFACAHGAMREILSFYTGTPAAKLQFSRNDCGKPFLCDHRVLDLRFSLSYRGHRALLGVAQSQEIGVDIEMFNDEIDANALVEAIFSESEKHEVSTFNEPEKLRAILQMWTRKEAVLKALGRGFSLDARTIEIGFAGNCGVVETSFGGEKPCNYWRDLNHGENYVASFSSQNNAGKLLFHDFPASTDEDFVLLKSLR